SKDCGSIIHPCAFRGFLGSHRGTLAGAAARRASVSQAADIAKAVPNSCGRRAVLDGLTRCPHSMPSLHGLLCKDGQACATVPGGRSVSSAVSEPVSVHRTPLSYARMTRGSYPCPRRLWDLAPLSYTTLLGGAERRNRRDYPAQRVFSHPE